MNKAVATGIAAGLTLLIGFIAYAEYNRYREAQAVAKVMEDLAASISTAAHGADAAMKSAARARREDQLLRQKQKQIENTMCALNADTSKCTCIHKSTGQLIDVSDELCTTYATR